VSECVAYIGVIASCSDSATKVSYILTATLSPLVNNVFAVPVVNQIVTVKQIKTYQFCAESKIDITAQIKSFSDACTCPENYANHQAIISRYSPAASMAELTWRFKGGDTMQVSGADTYMKPGPYYISVQANCVSDADCGYDRCTCAPCSNLPSSPYAMYIGPSIDFSSGKSEKAKLESCVVKDVLSGLSGECFEVCPVTVHTVYAYTSNLLPVGIQIAISIACLAFVLLVVGCYWRTHFQTYACCCPLVSETSRTFLFHAID
jgi:hypothetical protein